MYVSMAHILRHAAANHYAVMAANALNMEMARGIVSAADETQSPLIIIIGPGAMANHATAELMAPMIRTLAEGTNVPVALCLDHGPDLARVMKVLYNRYNSVMLDGSTLPMEENIAITKQVVDFCHPLDVGVEGELGHVGQAANFDDRDTSLYTRPEDAVYFAEQTGVDCLAVAIGTAHGKYPKDFVPKINFELLKEIKAATGGMPIALHGGSGSGDENILRAVEAGINKINLATDVQEAARMAAAEVNAGGGSYLECIQAAEQGCKKLLMHWMEIAGSCGQAKTFVKPDTFGMLQGNIKNPVKGE